jgi:hypothetical protein
MKNLGQNFGGLDRTKCVLNVDSSFNMSPNGVLSMCPGLVQAAGAHVHDIQIAFAQPDTATYASIVRYPPAVYAQWCAHWRLNDVKISNAWVGIDMRGNVGNTLAANLEMSTGAQDISTVLVQKGLLLGGLLNDPLRSFDSKR